MLIVLWQNRLAIQVAILGACVFVAFWRGAAPERRIAGTFVLMFALDRIYHNLFGPGHIIHGANLGHILIDSVATALFAWIAFFANRVYPLWLAGFQLMAIVSHLVRAISPAIADNAYLLLMIYPSYLQTAVFALGVSLHIQREKIHGPYRSWRVSFSRLQESEQIERRELC